MKIEKQFVQLLNVLRSHDRDLNNKMNVEISNQEDLLNHKDEV